MLNMFRKIVTAALSIMLLCGVFAFGMPVASAASAPSVQWNKTYSGPYTYHGESILQAKDGTYCLTLARTDDCIIDEWLYNLKSNGTFNWKKSYTGVIYSVKQTADGGYILTGCIGRNCTLPSGYVIEAKDDVWIAKLSSTGKTEWQKCIEGTYAETGVCIVPAKDGGYLIAINSYNPDDSKGEGKYDFTPGSWVVKTNAAGEIQWQKQIAAGMQNYISCILESAEGGYLTLGTSDIMKAADGSSNHGWADAYVVKLNENGDKVWDKYIGGSWDDNAISAIQCGDGSYVFAGRTSSNDGDLSGYHGETDMWVFSLNKDGGLQWSKSLGGTYYDGAVSIDKTLDGGFVIAGDTISKNGDVKGAKAGRNTWLVKFNKNGDKQWQKFLDQNKYGEVFVIQQTKDGGYVTSGSLYKENQKQKAVATKFKTDPLYKKPALSGAAAEEINGNPDAILSIKATLKTAPIASLKAVIYNAKGMSVAVLKQTGQFSGKKELLWDGKATKGNGAKLAAGAMVPISKTGTGFTVVLSAKNVAGETISKKIKITLYS